MKKSSILLAGLGAMMGTYSLSNQRSFDPFGVRGLRTIPKFYQPCPKTVTAAELKRAAKKRRNTRARSKKK